MSSDISSLRVSPVTAAVDYIAEHFPESERLIAARHSAEELGCTTITPAAGTILRFITATARAKAVVEIGTGVGVSALYLLEGMAQDGVLTTIDIEPEYHRTARQMFLQAGLPAGRTRLITGRALEVLPRFTTGGYDLVFVDAAKIEYPTYYTQAIDLLRPGGVIVFHNVLEDGRLGSHSHRDPETMALRELTRLIRDDEQVAPAVIPVGGGFLVATVNGSATRF